MRNIIDAINTIVRSNVRVLSAAVATNNRVNAVGDQLEIFIKDSFAGALTDTDEVVRQTKRDALFSWIGNNSNPPDAMIRGGDAIEIKKVTSIGSIPLNSSTPEHKLSINNPRLTDDERNCEDWTEKDIIYAIGCAASGRVKNICFVYGEDYCATNEYDEMISSVKDAINNLDLPYGDKSFDTNELGHINKVDPLGVTYMRIRGMWGIKHPFNVFDYVYKYNRNHSFSLMCIINEDKLATFDNTDVLDQLMRDYPHFNVTDVEIKDPDNPSQFRSAKLITYYEL